jgi:hypothetical protein
MVLRTKVEITGVQGSPYLSVMHWDGTDQTDANGAIAAVAAFWTELEPQMSNDANWTTLEDVEVINTATGELTGVLSVNDINGAGTETTDRLSPATQALVRWRTGTIVNGRELRGRTFVPALTEAGLLDGQPSAGLASAVGSAVNEILGGATPLAIWHRPNDESVGSLAQVQTGSLWSLFAVLRSRRD